MRSLAAGMVQRAGCHRSCEKLKCIGDRRLLAVPGLPKSQPWRHATWVTAGHRYPYGFSLRRRFPILQSKRDQATRNPEPTMTACALHTGTTTPGIGLAGGLWRAGLVALRLLCCRHFRDRPT